MNSTILLKIITLEDLDKALDETVIYEKAKDALFMLLIDAVLDGTLAQLVDKDKALNDTVICKKAKDALFILLTGEVLGDTLAQMIDKDKALNQALCNLLKDAYNTLLKDLEEDTLKETLNKIKKDDDLYKDLYKDLNDKQLVAKLRIAAHDDKLSKALDAALHNTRDAWVNRVQNEKIKLQELQRDNINYQEFSKVLDWFSFDYYQSENSTKEFIKKHLDAIVKSNNPNTMLERLLLFHLAQRHNKEKFQENIGRFQEFLNTSLEHLKAFEYLIGDSLSIDPGYKRVENIAIDKLNRKNISAFIENPVLSPLKIVTEPPEPINFFTFLSVLWWALVNRNNNSQPLIDRVTAAFKETQIKSKTYKNYLKELSESIKEYQQIYKYGVDGLTLKILDEKKAIKDDIDFKVLAHDLCALSYLYRFGITIAKRNAAMDKLFKKFKSLNTVDSIIRDKLKVLSWIYKGFYGNMNTAGKEFMQRHLDKIMDCDHPKEALNALYLIYFYKLHNKTSTNNIIDAVLKNNSPESFFNEFMRRLVSLNAHPNLLEEDEITSALDVLVAQCSQSNTTINIKVSEVITSEKETAIPNQNRSTTATQSFYSCKEQPHSPVPNANTPRISN